MTTDDAPPPPLSTIPESLTCYDQWVCWEYQQRGNATKPTKVPIDVHNGSMADTTNSATWTSFDNACEFHVTHDNTDGVGIVFTPDDNLCGIDLDNCIDVTTNTMASWAEEIVTDIGSYTEISPSGTGVKIFIEGAKPGKKCRKSIEDGEIEIYDQNRYFTVTGNHFRDTPLEVKQCQEQLDLLYKRVFEDTADSSQILQPVKELLTDEQIIEKASFASNCDKFLKLMAGYWEGYYKSESEADLGLLGILKFYTQSSSQLDRIYRKSRLMRDKWDTKRGETTYGQSTINKALQSTTNTYQSSVPRRKEPSILSTEDTPPDEEPAAIPPEFGTKDEASGKTVLSTRRTLPTAKAFVHQFYTKQYQRTLFHYADRFYFWTGKHYEQIEDGGLKSKLHPWLDNAVCIKVDKDGTWDLESFPASSTSVKSALEALQNHTHLSSTHAIPFWVEPSGKLPDCSELIPFKSGLLHLPTLKGIPHTPNFLNTWSLDYDYEPNAKTPKRWLMFLDELFSDDIESKQLLQEWIGYLLTCDTSQQKMLYVVGPKRSGKGTIGRVLQTLLGRENIINPTTQVLGDTFGLQPLISKSVAIISDARFSDKNVSTAIEHMLNISGEDAITVNRKNREHVNVKFPTRLMFLSNELPKLPDTSGALAGRFLILKLERSFYGEEDQKLTGKLLEELPGILNWAIEGWQRLNERGYFIEPQHSKDAKQELEDLGSPVGAFFREHCEIGLGETVWTDSLYKLWKEWCECEGMPASTKSVFSKELKAVCPVIEIKRAKGQKKCYNGIRYKKEAGDDAS